jgi:hypothetical protein
VVILEVRVEGRILLSNLAFCARSVSAPSAIAFCILCKGTKIAMAVSVARQSFIVAHEIPPSKLVFWNVHSGHLHRQDFDYTRAKRSGRIDLITADDVLFRNTAACP